jgi:hypothetical protein
MERYTYTGFKVDSNIGLDSIIVFADPEGFDSKGFEGERDEEGWEDEDRACACI